MPFHSAVIIDSMLLTLWYNKLIDGFRTVQLTVKENGWMDGWMDGKPAQREH